MSRKKALSHCCRVQSYLDPCEINVVSLLISDSSQRSAVYKDRPVGKLFKDNQKKGSFKFESCKPTNPLAKDISLSLKTITDSKISPFPQTLNGAQGLLLKQLM